MRCARAGFVLGLLAAVAPAGATAQATVAGPARAVVFRTRTMGTWASVSIVTADSAAVADLALESLLVFHRVDSLMSNWSDVSEVARINREAGRGPTRVHPEVATVLACAQRVTRESDGAQDISVEPLVRLWGFLGGTPHVPDPAEIAKTLERVGADKVRFDPETATISFARADVAIDLGGIAKGYGVDEVAAVLRRAGVRDALVDLTGNMAAMGNAPGHPGWVVGVRDPSGRRPHLLRIRLRDECIATSGDYEQFVAADGRRYGHIIDPRTGASAQGLRSVTVVAASAMLADAWDTGLFVLGPEEARKLARARDDLAVVLVEPGPDGDFIVWVEEQLRARIEVEDERTRTYTVRFF
jgi:thiamine biosynthesis lipoprotein